MKPAIVPDRKPPLHIVAMATFAMCSDGTTRKVILQKGQARKLHNYVKHNLSGGMITLAKEPVRDSLARKLRALSEPRPFHPPWRRNSTTS